MIPIVVASGVQARRQVEGRQGGKGVHQTCLLCERCEESKGRGVGFVAPCRKEGTRQVVTKRRIVKQVNDAQRPVTPKEFFNALEYRMFMSRPTRFTSSTLVAIESHNTVLRCNCGPNSSCGVLPHLPASSAWTSDSVGGFFVYSSANIPQTKACVLPIN